MSKELRIPRGCPRMTSSAKLVMYDLVMGGKQQVAREFISSQPEGETVDAS